MARPRKLGLAYFPLDCVLDSNVEKLEIAFGAEGFTVLIKAWQECYLQPDGRLDISDPLSRSLYARHAHVSVERWEEIIAVAVKVGLFDKTLFEAGTLSSNGIQKRLREIEAERERSRKRASKSAAEKSTSAAEKDMSSAPQNPRRTTEEPPQNSGSAPQNTGTTGEKEMEREKEMKRESVWGKHTAREERGEPAPTSHPPPLAEHIVQLPTGEAFIPTDRVLESAMTLHEFPEEWRSVLKLWIEIHDAEFPRQYDVARLRQLLDLHPIEAVENAIRAMGDAGRRAIKHLMEALNGTASLQIIPGSSGPDHQGDGTGGAYPGPDDPRVIEGLRLLGFGPEEPVANGRTAARSG